MALACEQTTPPCTEGVDWTVFKQPLPVCQAQVDRLATALSNTQHGVAVNNRITRPLNGRIVKQTPP